MSYTSSHHQFHIDARFPIDAFTEMSDFFNMYSLGIDYFEELSVLVSIPTDYLLNASFTAAYDDFINTVKHACPNVMVVPMANHDDGTSLQLTLQYKQNQAVKQKPNGIFQKIFTAIIPQFEQQITAEPKLPTQPSAPPVSMPTFAKPAKPTKQPQKPVSTPKPKTPSTTGTATPQPNGDTHTWLAYKNVLTQAIQEAVNQFMENSQPMGKLSLQTITFKTSDGLSRAFFEHVMAAFNQQPSPMNTDFVSYVQQELLPRLQPTNVGFSNMLDIQLQNKTKATSFDTNKVTNKAFNINDINIRVDLNFSTKQKVVQPGFTASTTPNRPKPKTARHIAKALNTYKGQHPINSNHYRNRLRIGIERFNEADEQVINAFPVVFSDKRHGGQQINLSIPNLLGDYFMLVEQDSQVYIEGINPRLKMLVNGQTQVTDGYMIVPNDRLRVADGVFVTFRVDM